MEILIEQFKLKNKDSKLNKLKKSWLNEQETRAVKKH